MAIQGNLVQVAPDLVAVEYVAGIPAGDLFSPWMMSTASDFTVEGAIRAGRFPTPSAALGFLTAVYDENGDPPYALPIQGLRPPYTIIGSLYPESDFLEPTKGQIWPRIG